MPKTLQFRRGTTAELSSETGSLAELFVDTDKDTVVVMDGSTSGGFELTQNAATQTLTNKTLTSPTINTATIEGGTIGTSTAVTELQVDNINIDGNIISSTNTDGNISLDPNGTGTIDVNSAKITSLGAPSAGTDAATKTYVDTIAAAGIHYHTAVRVEAPSNLNATYDNGTSGVGATLTNAGTQAAISIDGVALSLNDRVLVYTQTNAAHNGVYTVTTVGDGASNWVLTRSTDTDSYGASDDDALGEGDAFFVQEGDTGAGELYVMTTTGTITFGTTDINFTVIAETAIYSAGDALTLTGTTFSANVDDSTIEIASDNLRVKDAGITDAKLATNAVTTDKITDNNVTVAKLATTLDLSSNTVTLPSTFTTNSNTQTFTNKSFDANGTGNSITNIEVTDLASGVLDTDLSSVSGSDDTLASAKAIKALVDTKYSIQEPVDALTAATGTVTHDLNNGNIFYHSSISADFTANFTNVDTTNNNAFGVTLILDQGATAYLPTAVQIAGSAQTINWFGAAAPEGTANQTDIISFTLLRVGSAWKVYGVLNSYDPVA